MYSSYEYSNLQAEALRWKNLSIQIDQDKTILQDQVGKLRQELETLKATQAKESFEKHRLELEVQGYSISSQRLEQTLKKVENEKETLRLRLDDANVTIQRVRESYDYANTRAIERDAEISSMRHDYQLLNDAHTKTLEDLNRRPTQEAYDRVKDEREDLKRINRDQFRRLRLATELLEDNMEALRQSNSNVDDSVTGGAIANVAANAEVPNENIIVNHFNSGMSWNLSNQSNQMRYEVDSDGEILWE